MLDHQLDEDLLNCVGQLHNRDSEHSRGHVHCRAAYTTDLFIKTAQFTAVNEHAVIFRGQQGDVAEPAEYQIPGSAPPELINTTLTRLRAAKDCSALTNRDVNLRYSNSCNSAACRLLGPEYHFHTLRGVYVVICYNACLPHRYSMNAFVSRVLGHSSLGSSLHYSAIHVESSKKGIGLSGVQSSRYQRPATLAFNASM